MDKLHRAVSLEDYEAFARDVLQHSAFEYVASGAADEKTLHSNRSSFDRWTLNPKILVDVSSLDLHVKLFGRDHVSPILLAPTGYHQLVHSRGEMETIAGANQADCTMVASSFANIAFEEVQSAAQRPQWFQLYVQQDRELTRSLIERVLANGCEAICLTVDLAVNAKRDREERAGFELPSGMTRGNLVNIGSNQAAAPHSLQSDSIYNPVRAADLTWKDIDWLRSIVDVPLLLKGVLRAEDAEMALKSGCDGIIVSNHGGRALDGVSSTIDALPGIVDRVGPEFTVLMDGGIRRGTDVVKALALGAKAVLIGRPYLFALAVGGSAEVSNAIHTLRHELAIAMGLLGCPNIASINRQTIIRS
jgi:4-hydroxymandelate oxidase